MSPLAGFEVTTYGRFWGDHRGITGHLIRQCQWEVTFPCHSIVG